MPIAADWDAQRRMWTLEVGERFTLDEITGLIEKTEWRRTGGSYRWKIHHQNAGKRTRYTSDSRGT